MPVIPIQSHDLHHLFGRLKIRAEILAVMFHPRDEQKRAAFTNAFTLARAHGVADAIEACSKAEVGITVTSSARKLMKDLPHLDAVLSDATKPFIRAADKVEKKTPPLSAGQVAGIVLRDFIASETETPAKARLGSVIETLSNDIRAHGKPMNSGPEDIKRAWAEYRPVAHLWAAAEILSDEFGAVELVPATSFLHMTAFMHSSESIRHMAESIRIKHAGQLISTEEIWRLPNGSSAANAN